MPIDREKAMSATIDGGEFSWDQNKLILYALGVGIGINEKQTDPKKVLQYTYEKDLKALPTFGVIPINGSIIGMISLDSVKINFAFLLHGEQYTEIIKSPLPLSAKTKNTAKIIGVYDKGKAALVELEVETRDAATDELIVKNVSSFFIRGEGGFGKEDDPKAPPPGNEPPEGDPDAVVEYPTMTHQALIYRLSGDINPLHCDPDMAAMAGFDMPILHGLCTFGNVGRAVIENFADCDPTKFKSIKVRFSKPVFPGETIVVKMWKISDKEIICEASVKEREVNVITNAKVELF